MVQNITVVEGLQDALADTVGLLASSGLRGCGTHVPAADVAVHHHNKTVRTCSHKALKSTSEPLQCPARAAPIAAKLIRGTGIASMAA